MTVAGKRRRGGATNGAPEWDREGLLGQDVEDSFREARTRFLAVPWGAAGRVGENERALLLAIADPRVLFHEPERAADGGGLSHAGWNAALSLCSVFNAGRIAARGETVPEAELAFARGIIGRATGAFGDEP